MQLAREENVHVCLPSFRIVWRSRLPSTSLLVETFLESDQAPGACCAGYLLAAPGSDVPLAAGGQHGSRGSGESW